MPGFDNNEYRMITQIRVYADYYDTQCESDKASINAVNMYVETDLFEKYSEQIPHNNETYNASKSLNEIARELQTKYQSGKPSTQYCKIKYTSISNSAKILQHVLGSKSR